MLLKNKWLLYLLQGAQSEEVSRYSGTTIISIHLPENEILYLSLTPETTYQDLHHLMGDMLDQTGLNAANFEREILKFSKDHPLKAIQKTRSYDDFVSNKAA